MSSNLPGVAPPNLKHLVAAHVRHAIFSGQLLPHQKVDQFALATHIGVSKLPVREALIVLESEGLVENIPRRGYFVANLSANDVLDHYRLIGLVTGLAARRAALSATRADLDRLRRILDQLDREEVPAAQERLNHDFHRQINLIGGSRRLNSEVRRLTNTMPSRFYELTHETAGTQDWGKLARPQHRRILRAIEARDPEEADRATVDHISAGGSVLLQRMTEIGLMDGDGSKALTSLPSEAI